MHLLYNVPNQSNKMSMIPKDTIKVPQINAPTVNTLLFKSKLHFKFPIFCIFQLIAIGTMIAIIAKITPETFNILMNAFGMNIDTDAGANTIQINDFHFGIFHSC